MYKCSHCDRQFDRYEDYYKVVGEDVAFCESCKDDLVNYEFCELLGIDIMVCTADDDEDY